MRRKRSSGESFEDSEEMQFEKRSTGGSSRCGENHISKKHQDKKTGNSQKQKLGHQDSKVQERNKMKN